MGLHKGQTNNPNGRPANPEAVELREALKFVGQKKGKSFLIHCAEKGFESESMAIAIMKKILPDKIEDDGIKDFVRTFLIRAK